MWFFLGMGIGAIIGWFIREKRMKQEIVEIEANLKKQIRAYLIEEAVKNVTGTMDFNTAPEKDNSKEKIRARRRAVLQNSIPFPPQFNQEYEICYVDAKDDETTRNITIHSIILNNDRSIRAVSAYCHMRRRARIFYVDRMTQVTDLSTGEVIESPSEFFLNIPLEAS